eukprot:Nk52_evm1s1086 gene=Nk52_evmTU1s1086
MSWSERCRRNLPKRNIWRDPKFGLFALHIRDNHWVFILAHVEEGALYEFDSFNNHVTSTHSFQIAGLQSFLNSTIKRCSWPIYKVKVPQQTNHCDCGVYMILLMTCLVKNNFDLSKIHPELFLPADVTRFRLCLSLLFRYAYTHNDDFVLLTDDLVYKSFVKK